MRKTQLKAPILLGTRGYSGVLIQPSLWSEEAPGWDELHSDFFTHGGIIEHAGIDQTVPTPESAESQENPDSTASTQDASMSGVDMTASRDLADPVDHLYPVQPKGTPRMPWDVRQALPFGTSMHPFGCGCEGCKQEGIVAMQGMGATASLPKWTLPAAAAALAALYLAYKKGYLKF